MSSPIHQPKDLDAALHYAPPWARERGLMAGTGEPYAQVAERSPRLQNDHWQTGSNGESEMTRLQRQLERHSNPAFEPSRELARSLWPVVFRMCAVTGFAAVVAWTMVSVSDTHEFDTKAERRVAPLKHLALDRVQTVLLQPVAEVSPPVPTEQPAAMIQPSAPADVAGNQRPPQAEAPPSPPPQSDATPPPRPTPALDSGEIATLVKRGQDLLQNGDLASARLLLQRAAEAGSAAAALGLGATYDPLIIRRLGVIGLKPDPERAREWYSRGVALGSDLASQRLADLGRAR